MADVLRENLVESALRNNFGSSLYIFLYNYVFKEKRVEKKMDGKSVGNKEDGKEKGLQLELRGDGKIPVISIEAENLAEAVHKTIIACYERGVRIETPKHKFEEGTSLGYDAHITTNIKFPDNEPKVHKVGMSEDGRGLMQYILEVTHGIHNHWKKSPEHPLRWNYTYNERFVNQLPFVSKRIKLDWEKRIGQWGKGIGRASGRDYQFNIWIHGEDTIFEQEDAPCLQSGQIRLMIDEKGELVMDYLTTWRSRDLAKAWNENIIGQIELMKLFKNKISHMLGVPIKLGNYIDTSTSLHLYGEYMDHGFEDLIKEMRRVPYKEKSYNLEDYLTLPPDLESIPWPNTIEAQKRLIAAQMDAEKKGYGLNLPRKELIEELGYDLEKFAYPKEWDTWPKSWDAEPDRSKLARVP